MDFETYERSKQTDYSALAETVASILQAAIQAYPTAFRLQQVQHRAKSSISLKKKLEDRSLQTTTNLEANIKDLAGCRLIFYTNSDVSRFLQTGIIQDNFDVDWTRTKIHHPVPGKTDPDNLFISNNYVVALKENRSSLPEYARFTGLACEVQIQTILNHAWSEMVHDILYKKPQLDGFGGNLFETIQQRFQAVMRTYLLPAGFEFQKAFEDYERLMSGKAIIDRGALKALAECSDNNARLELLERFRDYALPNYDEPMNVHLEIKDSIVEAIKQARATEQKEIDTPFGSYPGITVERVVEVGAEILTQLRYVGIETTFDAICELYPGAQSDGERKTLLELTKRLAQQNLDIWKKAGPYVQIVLVQRIGDLSELDAKILRPVILEILRNALNSELEGVSSTYNSMTLHRGTAVASNELSNLRSKALDILFKLYRNAVSISEKLSTENAIFCAASLPSSAQYSSELLSLILNDSARIVDFCGEIATGDDYEVIQKVENKILWLHRRTSGIEKKSNPNKEEITAAKGLSRSIRRFRSVANRNRKFVIYKTLVGYDSVFPPMWKNQKTEIKDEESYRNKLINKLVTEVNEESSEEWFKLIQRCAQTDSDDLATFPSFGRFLQKLSRVQPLIMISYIERFDKNLTGFLGIILSGLVESDHRIEAEAKILQWLDEDRYLNQIAHFFRFATEFKSPQVIKILEGGIRLRDDDVVAQVLSTVFARYKDGTPDLIEGVILPGIKYFTDRKDARWVNVAWYISKDVSPLSELTSAQSEIILKSLIFANRIDTHTEWILATLADSDPERVFRFLCDRLKFSAENSGEGRYEAIPYELHKLRKRFSKLAEYAVDTIREWFVVGDPMFQFTGGRLIVSSFPDFPDTLKAKLSSQINSELREEIEFVIQILSAYRGEQFLYENCKEMVKALAIDDELLDDVRSIIERTGVVSGEFGLVEAYQEKREALMPWRSDGNSKVRSFAERYIGDLDSRIAAEQRRSEERLEMRKRMYENPPNQND